MEKSTCCRLEEERRIHGDKACPWLPLSTIDEVFSGNANLSFPNFPSQDIFQPNATVHVYAYARPI